MSGSGQVSGTLWALLAAFQVILLCIDIAKDSHNLSNKRPSLILKVMCSLQPTDARRCN